LNLVSHAFVCFIRSLKPSRMRLGRFFIYPLTELLEIQQTNEHGSFSFCCHVGVCNILEEVVQVNERFLLVSRGFWWWLILFSIGVFTCLMCILFSPLMGRFFGHSFFVDV
jgi:hypothetical protein